MEKSDKYDIWEGGRNNSAVIPAKGGCVAIQFLFLFFLDLVGSRERQGPGRYLRDGKRRTSGPEKLGLVLENYFSGNSDDGDCDPIFGRELRPYFREQSCRFAWHSTGLLYPFCA